MNLLGNLALIGGGFIKNLRPENLAVDPVAPVVGQVWFNTAEVALKYFDGVEVHQIAQGGDLDEYLRRDGTLAMTAELELSSNDQTGAADTSAVSKGHVDAGLALKEDVITGAATTIVQDDLGSDLAMTTNASGKVAVSTTSSAQLGYLSTTTSDVQSQLDGKEATLGFTPLDKAGDSMTGDLVMGGNQVIGLPAATDPTSPMRKAEFDSALSGLNWQPDVQAHQDDASTDPGATPATGDRYIINDIAALHVNFGTIADVANGDIVEFDGTDFVVVFDVSTDPLADGALAYCHAEGEYHRFVGGVWSTFYGLDAAVAGAGIVKNGNTFDINFGAGIIETPLDEVGIHYAPDGGMWTQIAGAESNAAESTLAIKLNGASLETTVDGLAIKADGVDETHLISSALGNGIQGGSGVALNVKADTGIVVTVDGVAFDETYGDARYGNLTGDTFTGAVKGIAPVDAADFTRKDYVDAADLVLTNAITALDSKLEAGHFVYEEVSTPASSHVVAHGFANKYVDVTVVDTSDEVILPDSVVFTDDNTVTVGFTSPILCRVIVTGANKS